MYSRETELRHLKPNDVYKLGVILDDNNCWKKLMEIIPKDGENSNPNERATAFKYNNDHIRLIEAAIKRPGESRLCSEILIDEWGTSGRKSERPNLEKLLKLLVQAELYRAADFVATHFLNEPAPQRPLSGPAARIGISLSDDIFEDIEDFVNDSSYYPGTSAINDNANYNNSATDNNKDLYEKYHKMDKHLIVNETPKPPPRNRSGRIRTHTNQEDSGSFIKSSTNNLEDAISSEPQYNAEAISSELTHSHFQNIPKLTELIANSANDTKLRSNSPSQITMSTTLSEASIPMFSALRSDIDKGTEEISTHMSELPVISTLNINGEHDRASNDQINSDVREIDIDINLERRHSNASSSSLSNDSIEDLSLGDQKASITYNDECAEDSVPHLSIFEQNSSNNDSSLTTVTGTSDENSFELSLNDASSVSNDDNIPCLSALK